MADLLRLIGSINVKLPCPNMADELAAATGISTEVCRQMIVSLRDTSKTALLRLDIPARTTQ